MRAINNPLAMAALLSAAYLGCGTAYEDIYLPLTDPKLAVTSGTGGSGGGGGTGGTGGTGGGGAPPDCSGDPSVANTIEDCAVFARADAVDDKGDGSRDKPYKTLQEAIDKAGSKRVYACTSAPFAEAVTISAGSTVVGGFDCLKGWTWSSKGKSVLNGPAGAIALTLAAGADKAKVENFAITSANADAAMKGSSSIAVAVADVVAELARCEVTSGNGADGEDGVTPADPVVKGADAVPPDPATMNACIAPNAVTGGAPGTTVCDDGMSSGGSGGKGGITGTDSGNGQKGADGEPLPDPNPDLYGLGGSGQTDPVGKCKDGGKGNDGLSGPAGAGGSALGLLSLAGLTSDEDTGGKPGTRGQGGGGGGGAKAGSFCPPGGVTDGVGASGGGGGAGGCGGKGGGGGKAGGSSIAILSLGTKLVLNEVTLGTGKGGKGGVGAIGQGGGGFGSGVAGGASSGIAGSKVGCKGGDGGSGGDGGPGGGGRGGHSIGLAYASALAAPPAIKMFSPGMPGDGGTAGPGAPMASNGAKGTIGLCWDFAKNASCGP